jgi:hypothetical protein
MYISTMKKKCYLILVLLSFPVLSQKIVIDSLSNKTISFAEMYSEKGEILGITDYNGEISLEQLTKINKLNVKQINIRHNNYQNRNISLKELFSSNNISLIPFQMDKINKLDEVIVLSHNKKKYIKLTAYFRNIQFNNNQPQYYMDGIVEYYISTKNGKVKINVLQNRSLKDPDIIQIDEKGLIRLNFNIAGVPSFGNFIDYQKLEKEYTINDLNNFGTVNKDNLEIGKIRTEDEKTFLDMEIYSKKNPKVMSLLGTESILENYTVNAIYRKNKSINKLKDLLYFKEYREYNIKQKRDIVYTHINCINEVYIIDKEFTDVEAKSDNNFYSFINESNYEDDFWKKANNNYITPIPETVIQFIEKKVNKKNNLFPKQ